MRIFSHTGTGDLYFTDLDLVTAYGAAAFSEINTEPDDPDVVVDEEFQAFMQMKLDDSFVTFFKWPLDALTQNKLCERS